MSQLSQRGHNKIIESIYTWHMVLSPSFMC